MIVTTDKHSLVSANMK